MDDIEATRRIVAAGACSRILVLTRFDLDECVHAAIRAGSSGFLLQDARPEELLAGIRAVAVRDAVIAPALTRRLLDEFAQYVPSHTTDPLEDPRLTSLTDREREILVAVGKGWTNGEIAARFVLFRLCSGPDEPWPTRVPEAPKLWQRGLGQRPGAMPSCLP
jgi:DNA-binding NarL/FixJ family response regulator